ncbi:MAG TPA: hypothetical protein VIT20_06360 [Propionibacteriaceae bacterium]
MATRVLISLLAGSDPRPVLTGLTELGAETVQPPQPELPDVCIATVDESTVEPDEWALRAARLPGVQGAEVDRMRFSF